MQAVVSTCLWFNISWTAWCPPLRNAFCYSLQSSPYRTRKRGQEALTRQLREASAHVNDLKTTLWEVRESEAVSCPP